MQQPTNQRTRPPAFACLVLLSLLERKKDETGRNFFPSNQLLIGRGVSGVRDRPFFLRAVILKAVGLASDSE